MPSERSSHALADESVGQLREPVLQLLRVVFHHAHDDGAGDASPEDLRVLLRQLCMTARANGMRAESLILVLKSAWRQFPEARGATRLDAEVKLAGVITLCIEEYYSPASPSTRRGVAVHPPAGRDDLHLT